MTVLTRFAPSPTGRLHVGNARIALINWLFARKAGGRFLLRMDDTDSERSADSFADAILSDLNWLGLHWDGFYRQSERLDLYQEAFEKLRQMGRLYPCYESEEELAFKRRRQRAAGQPPIYDRAALSLDEDGRAALEKEGRVPHWRFLLEDAAIAWDDLVHGPMHFPGRSVSDPVLYRSDGRPLYTLTSVVDDAALGITHIVRGDDHLANSAAQLQLFAALGTPLPSFAHLPLMTDAAGKALSKRQASLSLGQLREDGIEPEPLASLLARLGTSEAVMPSETLGDLAESFDFAHISRAPVKFDSGALARLNQRFLHEMPYEMATVRFDDDDFPFDEAFWLAVRPNIDTLADVKTWWGVCHRPLVPVMEDADFLDSARALLPEGPFDAGTFDAWTAQLKIKTGRKGAGLFRPLRLALTGREHGPALQNLLPLIGRKRALARLSGVTA